jgi:hypothetical protein
MYMSYRDSGIIIGDLFLELQARALPRNSVFVLANVKQYDDDHIVEPREMGGSLTMPVLLS